MLRLLDGDSAHQYGLALAVALDDLLADGLPLVVLGHVDLVVLVLAGHRLVGGNHHHLKAVNLVEFHRLCLGGTGHAGKLVVHAEEVLEGDGGQGPVALGNADALLGLDCLVESVAVASPLKDAPGELVYNLHLAITHHVVHIGLVEGVGPHRLGKVVDVLEVALLKEAAGDKVAFLEDFFYFKHSLVGKGDPAGLLVQLVVSLDGLSLGLVGIVAGGGILFHLGELAHELVNLVELEGVVLAGTGDDEGGAGLINQNRVNFVHNAEGKVPLNLLTGVNLHVVTEIVKAQLVVGAVGDVAVVGELSGGIVHAGDDGAHRHPKVGVHRPHPVGVTLGKVVVHRHYVDTTAREAVEVGGRHRHEGLSLAGLHLHNAAGIQHDGAHQLHVVGPLPQHPVGGLPGQRKGFRQYVIQGLALGQTLLELLCLLGKIFGPQSLGPGFLLVDLLNHGQKLLYVTVPLGTKEKGQY